MADSISNAEDIIDSRNVIARLDELNDLHDEAQEAADEAEKAKLTAETDDEPDWETPCEVCGATPTVPETGMCGPCTFGDASTVGGNW